MSRADHEHILDREERATDALRRDFMARMVAIVHDELGDEGVMTGRTYARIRLALDRLMSEFYGDIRGASSPVRRLILDQSAYASQYAVEQERERFVRFVEDHADGRTASAA